LIDGAYPGLEAERGQGEAIARNIFEMIRLKVPIITVIVGGWSALGIGVGDKVYMMENIYSVISQSHVLLFYGKAGNTEQAAEALKLTSADMKKKKLVDDIPEPLGGAHYDRDHYF
jgi:acetyl-CoA carboxylase carboxyl transferase subunit alpha